MNILDITKQIKVPEGFRIKKVTYTEYNTLNDYDLNITFEKIKQ